MSRVETRPLLTQFEAEDHEAALLINTLFDGEKMQAQLEGRDWGDETVRRIALANAANLADDVLPQPPGYQNIASQQPSIDMQTWRDAQRWRQLRGAYLQDEALIAEQAVISQNPEDIRGAINTAAGRLHEIQAVHGEQEVIEYKLLTGDVAYIHLCAQAERRRRLAPAPNPEAPFRLLDHERQAALTGAWNATREITDEHNSNCALQLPIYDDDELKPSASEQLTADVTHLKFDNPPKAIVDLHRTPADGGPMQLAELTLQDRPEGIAEDTQRWTTPTQTVERPFSTPTIVSIAQQILPPEEVLTFEYIDPAEGR